MLLPLVLVVAARATGACVQGPVCSSPCVGENVGAVACERVQRAQICGRQGGSGRERAGIGLPHDPCAAIIVVVRPGGRSRVARLAVLWRWLWSLSSVARANPGHQHASVPAGPRARSLPSPSAHRPRHQHRRHRPDRLPRQDGPSGAWRLPPAPPLQQTRLPFGQRVRRSAASSSIPPSLAPPPSRPCSSSIPPSFSPISPAPPPPPPLLHSTPSSISKLPLWHWV